MMCFISSIRRLRLIHAAMLLTVAEGCGDGELMHPTIGDDLVTTSGVGGSTKPRVSLVQSRYASAEQLPAEEVYSLVAEAIAATGGFGFIHDGQTVVLKPNLVNTVTTGYVPLAPTVNGITTDWRVTHAVATLVRKQNPTGRIIVMEGSTENTTQAFQILGYTPTNFGTMVDEFIALEGASCDDRTSQGLVQKPSFGGKLLWANERYIGADVVISIAVLKTHLHAGITGSVKNLGVGATPASQYSNTGCSRTQSTDFIDHGRQGLAQFVADFYSLRKADFAVIDGLQGIQNGPNPLWVEGADYALDRMNMRLILAGRDAVAVDSVSAEVMGCNPSEVGHLSLLQANGFGVADPSMIQVVGSTIAAVRSEFKGPQWACGSP